MSADARHVVYRIDDRDVIVWVNDAWSRFAIENGAPGIATTAVGTSFWNHVAGESVRHLLRSILARVRWQQTEFALPYCCDAPDRRRPMTLTIRPLPSSHLEFHSVVQEERFRPTIALLDPAAPRASDLVLLCSWCNRVNVGEWMEVEEAVARLRLFDRPEQPRLTHGICSDCEAIVRAASPLRHAA